MKQILTEWRKYIAEEESGITDRLRNKWIEPMAKKKQRTI
jgi:hypothetical protein